MNLQDALLILEGIRLGVLPKVQRRLNDFERKFITAGNVYAWKENEMGMKRWTDGKSWLASKVKGPFLIYQEHDGTRNVKENGLVKQSFSLTTKQNEKFHLIAYYDPAERAKGNTTGKVPSQDPDLLKLLLDPSVYLSNFLHYGGGASSLLPQPNFMQSQQTQMLFPFSSATSTDSGALNNNLSSQKMMAHNGQMYTTQSQPGYFCHSLMASYQYVPNNSEQTQAAFQHPQQQLVYMQLIPAPSHSYTYGLPCVNAMEQDKFDQMNTFGSIVSGFSTSALSNANRRFSFPSASTPTNASGQYSCLSPETINSKPSSESPMFSSSKSTPHTPQSIPSPSLNRTPLVNPTKPELNPALAGSAFGVGGKTCAPQNHDVRTVAGLGKLFYV